MVFVDLFLICIAIPGLTEIDWGNQLYITMIETCVLSIVNILLSGYELYKLSEYLRYTSKNDKNWNPQRVKSGYQDDDADDGKRLSNLGGSNYVD